MKIGKLSETYSTTGQINPADIAEIKALGFAHIICNRPDEEVGQGMSCKDLATAAKAEGLDFHINPVSMQGPTPDNIAVQADILGSTCGPVLAYCGSGMRASICWALAQAGTTKVDDILSATAKAGYDLERLRPTLNARAS